MFERLTERSDAFDCIAIINPRDPEGLYELGDLDTDEDADLINAVADRLAAYEDSGLSPEQVQELAKAKAEGRLMIMPCKPGDIVFVRSGCLFYKDNAPYTRCEVVNLRKGKKGGIQMYLRSLAKSAYGTNYHRIFPASSIGVTVFLTREEAEKALQEGMK